MTARYARAILAVAGLWATAQLRGQAGSALQIVTETLPPATLGTGYLQQIASMGGICSPIGTATASLDDGALPPGLLLTAPNPSEKKWFLQGTPTASGSFRFTVHLRWNHQRVSPFDRDCLDEAAKAFILVVQAPPVLLTVDRSQIVTTFHTGHFPPAPDTVRVTSAGGTAAVPFTAQAITDTGGT
jgi:hypothetical protein